MADAIADRNLVYENVAVSGTVYLTLDSQLVYWHRFEQHINFNVVYDKGVPVLSNAKSQGFTSISNGQINYDRRHCNNLHVFSQISAVSDLDYSNPKPESDIDYADTVLSISFENQSPDDGNVCRDFEITDSVQDPVPTASVQDPVPTASVQDPVPTDSVQDPVPKNLGNLNSLTSPTKHGNFDITNSSSADMFVAEGDDVHKTVSEDKTIDNNHSINREDDLKESKRTSERLSHITLKTNRNSAPKVFLNEKAEFKKSKSQMKKAKDHKVKTKQKDSQSVVKSPKTWLNIKKFGDHETRRKLKKNIGEIAERPRAAKVRKLELEKDVKCEYCCETFKSQQEYFDHRKGERTSFKCKFCSKTVPFKAHLIVHMRKHNHLQEENPTLEDVGYKNGQSSEPKASDGSTEYKSGKQIKCEICGLIVSNIPILKTHTMMHTGEYAYKCCLCGEKSHSIAKHNNHLSTHLKSGKVQCKICNISFESRSDLSRHQLTHEFKCSICDKVFPNKTSRVFHYKMVHKDEILKCMVCGKMFSSEEELTPHLKYHRNRAKTQCTICGLFVTRLDNHILSHNQRTEESKNYVCDQCPKQFKQKLSFQRHMRTHSEEKPYACIECSKRFARSGGLRRHMITHTQERPFVCTICGKACSQMGNLRIHMQIHKDISPVQCKVCGENFSYKHSLQEHVRAVHFADLSSADPSTYVSTIPPDYY